MGIKPSAAIVQTARFKRKVHSSQNRNNPSTPPATPFNNTSFLIQLQQRREQAFATPTTSCLRFDQYGTMENMIACCSFATHCTTSPQSLPRPPISGTSTSQSSNLMSRSQITEYSRPHRQHGSTQTCDSGHHALPQQLNPRTEMGPKVGDGRHRYRQPVVDNDFDTHCADSGSQTGTFCKEAVAREME